MGKNARVASGNKEILMSINGVPVICITGGPCSGKTTGIAAIVQWLITHGHTPVLVPEAATRIILAGIVPGQHKISTDLFQQYIIADVLHTESLFAKALSASCAPKPILVCDRGALDGMAYVTPQSFRGMLNRMGLVEGQLRSERYDAVIHLVTAANGAEQFYTTANNEARRETPAQARKLDRRTLAAWYGARHLVVVDNSTSFAEKLHRVTGALARILGIPEPIEDERKFLIHAESVSAIPSTAVRIHITQHYLVTNDAAVERVRRWECAGHTMYFHTRKQRVDGGVSIETERMIDAKMYITLLDRADRTRHPISKTRYCFADTSGSYECDVFGGNLAGLCMLEIEGSTHAMPRTPPSFFGTTIDVTFDPRYRNENLALCTDIEGIRWQ
jgi:CYTH domain-containing protein/predicted ATPase